MNLRRIFSSALLLFILFASVSISVQAESQKEVSMSKASFGTTPDGQPVELYTLTNQNGMKVRLTNYGAIIVSIEIGRAHV